jgi:hypothetical protein
MPLPRQALNLMVVGALLLGAPRTAHAERVRFHFVPAGPGTIPMQPAGPGERLSVFGTPREPYSGSLRPTYLVTFQHAYTGQQVTVPMALPESTPRIEHVGNRVVFSYTSYTVEAAFLPDGSVDVTYDSGFLRPL